MSNIYESTPFTTYWYYLNVSKTACANCKTQSNHHLLRYRIYISSKFPVIPTSTTYHLVCSNCDHASRQDKEGDVAKIISRAKDSKPYKYNKYSQMDLDGYNEEEFIAFGTEKRTKVKKN